jgi:hypothetical protein
MVGKLQPLVNNQMIVGPDGKPTEYFIRWAQQRQIDIGEAIDENRALEIIQAFIDDYQLQAGSGISITPNGKLTSNPTISAQAQAILNQISTVHGTILFRGATNWQALAPGTSGHFLRTNGANADPSWAAGGGGGGSVGWSNNLRWAQEITATATGTFSGNPNASLSSAPVNSFFWSNSSGAQNLVFDLGLAMGKICTGFRIFQNNTVSQGTWSFQGSDDNSTWTDIDTGWSWAPTTIQGFTYLERTFTNSTIYRYYRMIKTAGSTNSSPFVNWFHLRFE